MDTELNEINQTSQASEGKPAKKGGKIAKAAAIVLLCAWLIASLGLNVYQAVIQNQKVIAYIDHELERQAEEARKENEYIEDGFKVGGEYEIRSTTHISDAYKNGDDSQLSAEDKDTLKMARDVLDEVIEDGMDNYDKELAVYQWMVNNIGGRRSGSVISRPGGRRTAFTPHDVLTTKDAVCVGYATTFRLFMNMLGMNVHIVHNEYHSWDLVEIEADQWYHVDIYSDAHGTMFGNFNMTDKMCEMGHSWDQSALPEASSVKYSPAVRNSVELEGLMDLPAQYKKDLDEGRYTAYYRFKTPLTEEDMSAAEFLVQAIDTALDLSMDGWHYFRAYWYPGEGDEEILCLMMEKDDDEPSGDDPSIDYTTPEGKAIIQAIAEAFGLDPEMLGLRDDETDDPWAVPEWVEAAASATITTTQTGGSVIID